nr:exodeoxyribonuclease VII large subunit [Saprospiraceae bacterium]
MPGKNTPIQEKGISLYDLNNRIKRVLSANFSTPLWVRAEVASIKVRKGHRYLELIEKEESSDLVKSKAFASLWAGNYALLKRDMKEDIDLILKEGQEVLILLKVTFHALYGLSLQIQDIDPTFTVGKYFSKKQQLFNQIRKEKLDEPQKTLRIPYVMQRIAVISSPKAAGFKDFIQQIQQVSFRMDIRMDLYDTSMQGKLVESEMGEALEKIAGNKTDYDAVVIVRGGGAKLDLMDFDNYLLAKKIAHYPIPVITGIGHDIDFSALDLVSAISQKTPTAAAQFIIDLNDEFLGRIEVAKTKISEAAVRKITQHRHLLNQLRSELKGSAKIPLLKQNFSLAQMRSDLSMLSGYRMREAKNKLNNIKRELDISSPANILRRGYSIASKNGIVIKSSSEVGVQDQLRIVLSHGKLSVTVDEKE